MQFHLEKGKTYWKHFHSFEGLSGQPEREERGAAHTSLTTNNTEKPINETKSGPDTIHI